MGQHFLRTGKPYRTGKELIHPALGGINWTNTVGHRFCAPWNDFLVCNNSYHSPSRVPGRTKEPMAFAFRRRQQEGGKTPHSPYSRGRTECASVNNVLAGSTMVSTIVNGHNCRTAKKRNPFFMNFESHALLSTTPKAERDRTRPCASSASNRGKLVAIGNQRVNATQRTTCPFLSRKLAE